MTATAEANDRATAESERLPFLIDNFEVAFDAQRTIVEDCNFRSGQESLRQISNEKL
jgi:hypothetical protein